MPAPTLPRPAPVKRDVGGRYKGRKRVGRCGGEEEVRRRHAEAAGYAGGAPGVGIREDPGHGYGGRTECGNVREGCTRGQGGQGWFCQARLQQRRYAVSECILASTAVSPGPVCARRCCGVDFRSTCTFPGACKFSFRLLAVELDYNTMPRHVAMLPVCVVALMLMLTVLVPGVLVVGTPGTVHKDTSNNNNNNNAPSNFTVPPLLQLNSLDDVHSLVGLIHPRGSTLAAVPGGLKSPVRHCTRAQPAYWLPINASVLPFPFVSLPAGPLPAVPRPLKMLPLPAVPCWFDVWAPLAPCSF